MPSKQTGERPSNPRSVPVNPANPESDPAYITPTTLNATKYGSIATAVLATLSAVPVFVKALGVTISNSVVYGSFALAAVCVIAITVLIRTDLQVRSAAKVAALENLYASSGSDEGDEEVTEEDNAAYKAPTATMWTAGNLAIKLRDDERRYLALAIGWNPNTGALVYLVNKQGEKLRWVDDDEVHTAFYETNSTPVEKHT